MHVGAVFLFCSVSKNHLSCRIKSCPVGSRAKIVFLIHKTHHPTWWIVCLSVIIRSSVERDMSNVKKCLPFGVAGVAAVSNEKSILKSWRIRKAINNRMGRNKKLNRAERYEAKSFFSNGTTPVTILFVFVLFKQNLIENL